ncbi:MAG TPA: ABC transporter ATP-binding protein [Azospirillaceae bacterium]|nr:ABC transporter ATP-binding protein [Azospirillaceae bacterium]
MDLSIEHVSHAYDTREILHDVSLSVAPGEVVCLLGPSGCGKTTLLRLAAGLEPVQRGRMVLDGVEVAVPGRQLPPERREVGFVFQDFALFPHLTVLENVGFGIRNASGEAKRARALEMLARIGMDSRADSYPHMLSGGQQQRVALARALAPGPRLVLLDEPFSGLDARLRERLRDDALHMLKSAQVMALMVTHDAEEAMFMGDRIAVMDAGRILQLDRPEELYFRPTCTFVAEFFGEVNRLPGVIRETAALTPLGRVEAADGHAAGASVEVLVRPEGLLLLDPTESAADGLPSARVVAARMLGRSSLVHLSLEGEGAPVHLHARLPDCHVPATGTRVAVRLDQRLAFVFPTSRCPI